MHNKPHTEAAKEKMRNAIRPRKWNHLPEQKIVNRLLFTSATVQQIADEYGCSYSTICIIYRKWTSKKQRLQSKTRKQAARLRGRPNPVFAKWVRENNVWIGRKHTKSAKQKQSIAKKGKKHSIERRIAQSARLQGIPIEKWSGFATTKTDRLKSTGEYKNWRKQVFERDNWTCQKCNAKGGKLHPHHIKPKSTNPKVVFDVSNGITFCVKCHHKTDSYGVNMLTKTPK